MTYSEKGPAGQKDARVSIQRVSKSFDVHGPGGTHQVHALDNVSLDIFDGEIIALTGLSGCGKSTLLRIIMGLETATEGHVEVSGRVVTGCGYDRGLVFQHAELLPWRTALGNVEFGLELKGVGKKERRAIAEEYLELVGLSDAADRRPNQLSGGMKQRAGLARAMSVDPEVLLMDEPFGALDAQTRESLQLEVLNIHKRTGKTIIFVTHDLDEAVLLAHRVVVMSPHPGRIRTIVPVHIPADRTDMIAVRASQEFADIRNQLWRLMMAPHVEPVEVKA
jgi:NitT/TauT family transport system ATP-binding protein